MRFISEGTYLEWVLQGENVTYLSVMGTIAYNSLYAMQTNREDPDGLACAFNDFALVEIPLEAQNLVTPFFPRFGAPTAIANVSEIEDLQPISVYGNSPYWFRQPILQEKTGYVTKKPYPLVEDRVFLMVVAPPVFFGDSGSGVIAEGNLAAGIMMSAWGAEYRDAAQSPGEHLPAAGNGIAVTLSKALEYMEAHTDLRVKLAEP